MGLVPLRKKSQRALSLSTMREHNEKMAVYEPGNGFSPKTESAGILILDFLDFRWVRNKFLLFIGPQSVVVCYSSTNELRKNLFCQ